MTSSFSEYIPCHTAIQNKEIIQFANIEQVLSPLIPPFVFRIRYDLVIKIIKPHIQFWFVVTYIVQFSAHTAIEITLYKY